jgi:hypothetical protein
VRDEEDGRAGLAADPRQLELHALAGHLVQRAERLVHQQQRGPARQRAGDRHALLHAARELARPVVGELREPDQLEQLVGACAAPGPALAVQLQRQLDVGADGPPLEQAGLLEGDAVVLVEARLARRLAVDERGALRRLDQVGDDAQQRRLAAARRADERHELAGGDAEVDARERLRPGRASTPRERLADPLEAYGGRRGGGHVSTSWVS